MFVVYAWNFWTTFVADNTFLVNPGRSTDNPDASCGRRRPRHAARGRAKSPAVVRDAQAPRVARRADALVAALVVVRVGRARRDTQVVASGWGGAPNTAAAATAGTAGARHPPAAAVWAAAGRRLLPLAAAIRLSLRLVRPPASHRWPLAAAGLPPPFALRSGGRRTLQGAVAAAGRRPPVATCLPGSHNMPACLLSASCLPPAWPSRASARMCLPACRRLARRPRAPAATRQSASARLPACLHSPLVGPRGPAAPPAACLPAVRLPAMTRPLWAACCGPPARPPARLRAVGRLPALRKLRALAARDLCANEFARPPTRVHARSTRQRWRPSKAPREQGGAPARRRPKHGGAPARRRPGTRARRRPSGAPTPEQGGAP